MNFKEIFGDTEAKVLEVGESPFLGWVGRAIAASPLNVPVELPNGWWAVLCPDTEAKKLPNGTPYIWVDVRFYESREAVDEGSYIAHHELTLTRTGWGGLVSKRGPTRSRRSLGTVPEEKPE